MAWDHPDGALMREHTTETASSYHGSVTGRTGVTSHVPGDPWLAGQGAVAAALERSAPPLACPADWEPLNPDDDRQRCYGSANRNSFFGVGIVNAGRAGRIVIELDTVEAMRKVQELRLCP